jgi:TRAP-type transport system periplasmic protein
MNTKILLPLTLIIGLTLGLNIGLSDQVFAEKIKFKIATIAPDGTPWSVMLNRYKKKVSKDSNKRLKARVYLNSIKGDEQSIVRQVYQGKLQMGGVSTGALSTIVEDMDILELPYAFPDLKTADRVLEEVRPLVDELLAEKGLKLVMYSENGYRSFATKDKCVRQPNDLKALKMRSQESEVHVETYRALGASPVTISVGEVLSSLQTGVVKGFDNTPIIAQALGWSQAVKYFSTSRHIYQPALIIINKAWLDALPEDLQKIVLDTGRAMEKKSRKAVRKLEPALMENFKNMGVEVCRLTDAERAAFKKATEKVWDIRAKRASAKGKLLIEKLKAARK